MSVTDNGAPLPVTEPVSGPQPRTVEETVLVALDLLEMTHALWPAEAGNIVLDWHWPLTPFVDISADIPDRWSIATARKTVESAVRWRQCCHGCGKPMSERSREGRVRGPRLTAHFCSNACRQKAYRDRKKAS